jgi:hypothetical protein
VAVGEAVGDDVGAGANVSVGVEDGSMVRDESGFGSGVTVGGANVVQARIAASRARGAISRDGFEKAGMDFPFHFFNASL